MHDRAGSQASLQVVPDPGAPVSGAELAGLLARAERAVAGRLAAALDAEGATLERWRVLRALADGQGHPMYEIAAAALLPPPSLTRVVDGLVADALVHRHVDPSDRRRVLVLLTARGRALQRRLARRVERALEPQLEPLDAADAACLARVLSQLAG
jgi:DNA-binding MarR family transcriptional regulator